ncbi:MAG: hypothetical protein NC328_04790 [Muribaculum sp.]|nr:hypothetical protein [Muribaculum sp.]
MKRLMRAIYVFILCLMGMGLVSCEDIQKIINPSEDPKNVEEGIIGVWEANYYTTGTASYRVYNKTTGESYEVKRPQWSTKVDKDGKYYLSLRFEKNFIVPLSTSILFDIGGVSDESTQYHLGDSISYVLRNDSVIHSPLLTSEYEESEWVITEMNKKSFVLKCIQKGALRNPKPNTGLDTVCLGDTAYLHFIRLK